VLEWYLAAPEPVDPARPDPLDSFHPEPPAPSAWRTAAAAASCWRPWPGSSAAMWSVWPERRKALTRTSWSSPLWS